jgi:hypothetical protein
MIGATEAHLTSKRASSMSRCVRTVSMAGLMLAGDANVALAGMPAVTLSDLARMRFQTISFFLVVFLLCSWVVRWLWNSARKDFPRLPYLTFRRAITLVALWGMLFLLVLTMISGARELMTPGAWKKEGLTYKLKDASEAPKANVIEREGERRAALDRLRVALWTYARHHDGRFPPGETPSEIPDDAWRVPDPSGMRYRYIAGLLADRGDVPLAYEPGIFGSGRFALLTNGKVVLLTDGELTSAVAKAL